ncbi:Bromodomain-containing protein [Lactifluus subvellereus]|nr:Bromodomain-containing protein [Lactifluus subvellereus]
MSKRELGKLASVVDVDAPRAKRRREAVPQEEKKPNADVDVDVTGEANTRREQEDTTKLMQVKEQGLKLWHTVKDAVDKDGRSLSIDFLRLPNKRMYPDYYTIIKKPIALDKIKSQLEAGEYRSLLAVKNDLGQCFRNAKRYNLKDSQIFNDAKFLHKLISKEYVNMTGDTKGGAEGHDEEPAQEDGHESKDGIDDETKRKKTMTRLLTVRLDKLVAKKDDAGNTLSNDFMELPNKKIWAIYYKTISRPMSFEKIYKHLKRKEYLNAAHFAQDIELVFSNAMQFNEDHTPLWEAARQLKEYFAKLMSDLPPPYTVPHYAPKDSQRPSNGRIKLRVPPAQQSPPQASTSSTAASPPQTQPPLVLKVPAKDTQSQAPTASPSPIAGPSSASAPSPANVQAPLAPAPTRKSTNPPAQSAPAPAAAKTQAPTLRSVTLTITPTHRRLALDVRDGVRSWSLRLAPSERGLRVSDVRLFRSADSDNENDESEGEEEEEEEEEEEDGGDGDEDGGVGEGKDAARVQKERVGRVKRPPPVRVQLDKTEVECRGRGRWEVTLGPSPGARVLELCDVRAGDDKDTKGVWRVYLHCSA